MNEPLDKLVAFYKSLDDIPTPSLTLRRIGFADYARLALAPLAAALLAYGFIAICAYGPAEAKQIAPASLAIDRYALIELKSSPPEQKPNAHTRRAITTMRLT